MGVLGRKVNYSKLQALQKEIYNFQKVSAIFADYGYTTIKLADDWMGADFIALGPNGKSYLRVQLKSRLSFAKKYLSKKIFICFYDRKNASWYLYNHDKLLKSILAITNIGNTPSWKKAGSYTFPTVSAPILKSLYKYKL